MVPSEETPGTPTLPDPTVPTSTDLAQAPAMPSVDLPPPIWAGTACAAMIRARPASSCNSPRRLCGQLCLIAYKLCKGRTPCRVAGWRDGANVPRDNRVTDQARRTATFLYERLGSRQRDGTVELPRSRARNTSQCIPGTS